MCCGGCSRVEHRLFGTGCSVGCEYWFFLLGLVCGKWRTGWVVSGTLLGPEGSGVFFARLFSVGLPCWSYRHVCLVGGVVGAGVWWGSARILRTTQWTRASLWPSF